MNLFAWIDSCGQAMDEDEGQDDFIGACFDPELPITLIANYSLVVGT